MCVLYQRVLYQRVRWLMGATGTAKLDKRTTSLRPPKAPGNAWTTFFSDYIAVSHCVFLL